MFSESGGWIYNFAVTDTETHKAGYTIYKITSIVFPRKLPQTLNCLVVWRRFHDVKRLYRELKSRHKSCQLTGQVPQPVSCNYFKRFDEDAIEKRKKYILDLLNFAAHYPELYKCYGFTQFLYDSALPADTAPLDHLEEDSQPKVFANMLKEQEEKKKERRLSVMEDTFLKDLLQPKREIYALDEMQGSEMKSIAEPNKIDWISGLIDCEENDLVYKAALEFSMAVQAEVNQEYEKAHAAYLRGIDQLQKCCDCGLYKDTKSMLKAKIDDYSIRADKMNNRIHLEAKKLLLDITSIDELERPFQELFQFKVVGLLHEKLMIVSPHNDDRLQYIIKCIDKSPEDDRFSVIRLPRNVLYMINYLCYFQNECKYFILMPLVAAGCLKDHLNNVREYERQALSINQQNNAVDDSNRSNSLTLCSTNEFETIIQSSKQLLRSVTRTLENLKTLEDLQCPQAEEDQDSVSVQLPHPFLVGDVLKQWARELFVAICSLHENGIILRDLHTENLLLGERKELILSFFYGNDYDVQDNCEDCRISSWAIKNHYVAPERPLNSKSDWWSYGIVLYEILVGIPFKCAHPGRIDLYDCVQYPGEINLPANACDLINNLLQPVPEERLDYIDIKNHSYFEGTDWDSVIVNGKSH